MSQDTRDTQPRRVLVTGATGYIGGHVVGPLVEEGYELLVGDILGEVGSTGRSTGAHLHLTVKLLGERIDPQSLIDLFDE